MSTRRGAARREAASPGWPAVSGALALRLPMRPLPSYLLLQLNGGLPGHCQGLPHSTLLRSPMCGLPAGTRAPSRCPIAAPWPRLSSDRRQPCAGQWPGLSARWRAPARAWPPRRPAPWRSACWEPWRAPPRWVAGGVSSATQLPPLPQPATPCPPSPCPAGCGGGAGARGQHLCALLRGRGRLQQCRVLSGARGGGRRGGARIQPAR